MEQEKVDQIEQILQLPDERATLCFGIRQPYKKGKYETYEILTDSDGLIRGVTNRTTGITMI